MSERHLILHPVEAPVFELECVLVLGPFAATGKPTMASKLLPLQFVRSCAPGSIRVLAVTPADVPCRCSAEVSARKVQATVRPFTTDPIEVPTCLSVHLVGRARTSPQPWAQHSRQEYMANKRAFGRALPTDGPT